MNQSYKKSGVDVEAGYRSVELMREHVKSTHNSSVLGGIGGFGGMFEANFEGFKRPVLVSGTDGVGTKLKLAFMLDKHDTIGIDCVAMCVNDILCSGAKPLFFLDYIVCEKVIPEQVASIVSGISKGCLESGAALLGGETAEHPSEFPVGEYDLAGFCVGVADFNKIIDGKTIKPGDVLIGLPSSGIHSNGFSLWRKIYKNMPQSLAEELLTPTKIYKSDLDELGGEAALKGLAHITGGGWVENIPRMLPKGLEAVMDIRDYSPPEIFQKLMKDGGIPLEDMYCTANMGFGMVACVSPQDAEQLKYPVIGKVAEGSRRIVLW